MQDPMQLIDNLRVRFRDGATPSALIQHILMVRGDAISYSELCDVLQETFRLPVVRISPSSVTPERDHRGATLNKTLLMEIVQWRHDWDASRSHNCPGEPSWMDGLSLRTPEEIGSEVRAAPFPGLTQKSWDSLSPEERDTLHVHLTSSIIISQRVEVLSRLVERLQERLHELEQGQCSVPTTQNGPV